jgi:hypothetical protein
MPKKLNTFYTNGHPVTVHLTSPNPTPLRASPMILKKSARAAWPTCNN